MSKHLLPSCSAEPCTRFRISARVGAAAAEGVVVAAVRFCDVEAVVFWAEVVVALMVVVLTLSEILLVAVSNRF